MYGRGGYGGYQNNRYGRRRSRSPVARRRKSPSYEKYKKDFLELSTSPESERTFKLPDGIEK